MAFTANMPKLPSCRPYLPWAPRLLGAGPPDAASTGRQAGDSRSQALPGLTALRKRDLRDPNHPAVLSSQVTLSKSLICKVGSGFEPLTMLSMHQVHHSEAIVATASE